MRNMLIAATATLALLTAAISPDQDDAPGAGITIMLVRHAETAEDTRGGGDPDLSPAGAARAGDLARLLQHSGATHAFTSEYARTRQTLAPLAAELGLEAREHPAREVESLAATLRELPPGSVVVAAGHSNTVPALALQLGCELPGLEEHPRYGSLLGHDQYDRLFVLHLPAEGRSSVVELRYGCQAK